MGGAATFDDLPKSGKAKFDGDRKPFDQLKGMLVQFDLIGGFKPEVQQRYDASVTAA